jgi:hypothetical protein
MTTGLFELEAVAAAGFLYSTLAGDPALAALLGGAGDPRVAEDVAPPEWGYPLVVFQHLSPDDDARTAAGASRILTSGLWAVRAITEGMSYDPLAPIAQRAGELLHAAAGPAPAVEGYTAWVESVRVQPIRYPTEERGKQYRHLGGLYRLTVHTTTT